MGLFGKKKKTEPENELETQVQEIESENEDENTAQTPENAADVSDENASPEDIFKKQCAQLARCLRVMFPQQMLIGFYYAELQEEGYIDDFRCYTTKGELLDRDNIPVRCNMSVPDMISREEKLEQAFFLFRRAAIEFTQKPCNGVNLTLLNDGQVKIDIVSDPLVEGEEDERYGKFLDRVERSDPKFIPPVISEEVNQKIHELTKDTYRNIGQSFYNFIPGDEFKVAYMYAEFSERGVFYYNRIVLNDGTVIDGDNFVEHYGVNRTQAEERRNLIIQYVMEFRQVFAQEAPKPFNAITLKVTGGGEFSIHLGYGPTDEQNEIKRLEIWKKQFTGEDVPQQPPRPKRAQNVFSDDLTEAQKQATEIYMELGSEYFTYLPEREYSVAYLLIEFADDGNFIYHRIALDDGTLFDGDAALEEFELDNDESRDELNTVINLVTDIREIFINEGSKPFTAMTLAVSNQGHFRTFMDFDPVDPETRDSRLEAWKAKYNGGALDE